MNTNYSILLVEDDLPFSKVLGDFLQDQGFKVSTANTVSLARIKLNNQQFDLIILDLHLKVSSGEKIIEGIRENPLDINNKTPILIISGHVNSALLNKYKSVIQDALVKPFDKKTFLERVNNILLKK